MLSIILFFQRSRITFSAVAKPFSRYIAPIKASQLSEIILSSILIFLLLGLKVKIYFSKLIFFAISKQVFLLTNYANFLSSIPSFSSG